MKRILLPAVAAAALILAQGGHADAATAPGTLAVTATVQSSIGLVFNTDPSGITLGGSGTNAATMAFGSVSAFGGTLPANVTRTYGSGNFTLNTQFDVDVTLANSTSANYTLAVELATADAVNTWKVGGNAVTSTAATSLGATEAYNTNIMFPFALTIPNATATGTLISNTLNFTATAN
jgi:hypothetical protein